MHETFQNPRIQKALLTLAVLLSIFFVVKIFAEVKEYRYIGDEVNARRTISFNGEGEVFAIPDLATVTYTAMSRKDTVAAAQKEVTDKINASIDFLKKSGVEEKDIKTVNYSSNPQYEQQPPCYGYPCPMPTSKIIGYEVSQTISVKVRKTDDTGAILQGLGDIGVANISGPDFTIEDEDELKAEARELAIKDAEEKADELAEQLGVRLGKIVSFSESGNYPIYYAKEMAMNGAADAVATVPAPSLPTGENKITSNVTITYEIK